MKILQVVLIFCMLSMAVSYRAAVVEFNPDNTLQPNRNLEGFSFALQNLQQQGGAQIIVFPENGILGFPDDTPSRDDILPFLEQIPEPGSQTEPVNPCIDSGFNNSPILRNLSCFARNFQIVLVANMGETEPCNNCMDGRYQFNTNVVFESNGDLIAKYRKQHLFKDEKLLFDESTASSCVTFTTSFGVTFGTFICYDILFENPGNCLVTDNNIKNIVFPTAWGNNYPFYISIALQQGWSLKHQVNFMAANVQYTSYKDSGSLSYTSSGSGLYSSGYAKQYYISDVALVSARGQVLVSDLPDDPSNLGDASHNDGIINNAGNIKARTSTYINAIKFLESNSGSIEVEHKNAGRSIRCYLNYSIATAGPNERYALRAYIGVTPSDSTLKYAVCDIIKCESDSNCGTPVTGYTAETVFETIELSGTFPGSKEPDIYVRALGSGLELLSPSVLETNYNSKRVVVSGYNNPLLSVSIWARDAGVVLRISVFLLIIVVLVSILLV